MKRFIPVENLSYLIFSLTIFFPLLANPVNANTSDQLLGSWRGSVNEESVLLEFKTTDLLIYDGDQVQYQLKPGVIQVFTPEGLAEIPYRLQNGILTLTMAQGQVDFSREDELSAGKQKHIDQLIIQLLTTYTWKSMSYSGATGIDYEDASYSRAKSGKLSFFPNGTYILGEKTESHYTGTYSPGSGVDLASTANSTGTDGKWQINNGNLYASQGNGAMERIDFLINCNSKHLHKGKEPFLLTPDGNFHVVDGNVRCYCKAMYPTATASLILVIDGTEYMPDYK